MVIPSHPFILVASDIHGDEESFRRLALTASSPNCLSFICAGDLEPSAEIAEIVRNRTFPFLTVLGNCDFPWECESLCIGEVGRFAKATINGTRIFITHGHAASRPETYGLSSGDFDIVVTGHTHVPSLKRENGHVTLNPGSASRPRGGSEKGYAMIVFKSGKRGGAVVKTCTLDGKAVFPELPVFL